MEKNTWKTLAIIFGILFILETAFIAWGVGLANQEEELSIECYYDICEDYPEAYFEDNLCYCYEVNDYTSEYKVVKTTYID